MQTFRKLALATLTLLCVCPLGASATTVSNGLSFNGLSFNGLSFNGLSFNGLSFNGLSFNGLSFNGLSFNGLSFNGHLADGVAINELQPATKRAKAQIVLRTGEQVALY